MALHLKKFKDEHLQKLSKDGDTVEALKEEMAAVQAEQFADRASENIDDEELRDESTDDVQMSKEELQEKQMRELAEQHAQKVVENRLYHLSTQKQMSALEKGKYSPIEFGVDASQENDGDLDRERREQIMEAISEDPDIQRQLVRVEKLKMDLTTDKQTRYVEALKMAKNQEKPKIISDRSSASDFLDRWLDGDLNLPVEHGLEEALKGRSGIQPVEKDVGVIRETLDREQAEKDSIDQQAEAVGKKDEALYAFLSELRNEVKALKSNLDRATKQNQESQSQEAVPGSIHDPLKMFQQGMSPYSYPNPYVHPIYPYGMPPSMAYPHPAPPAPAGVGVLSEVDRLNRAAEDLERENAKFNIKSVDDLNPAKDTTDRHTRAYNRLELKHEEELRAMQLEIEYLKHKRQLDDLKLEMENERVMREREIEHNRFLMEQKQQLQAIKLKQVLAKEQKLLELHTNVGTGDDDDDSISGVRLISGVGPQQIPLELTRGCEVFVDGVCLASDHLKDIDSFRLAVGLFDNRGQGLNRLRASEWQDLKIRGLNQNSVVYLQNTVRRRADGDDLMQEPKLLVELQVRSKTDMAKSVGWGIVNITAQSGYTNDGGVYDHLNNDLWRVPLRPGISDPSVDPAIPFSFEEDVPASYVLLRIVESNDVNIATEWSPSMNGLNSVSEASKVYRLLGHLSEVEDEMDSLADDKSVVSGPKQNSKPPIGEDRSLAKVPSSGRSHSSRPTSARSEKDNSLNYVHGLDPVVEGEEDVEGIQPTGRITAKKKDTKESLWTRGVTNSIQESDLYEPGLGIDLYIDRAMYLPDNCTMTRVNVKTLSPDREVIGDVSESFAEGDSLAHSPVFSFKVELREKVFNNAASVLLRLDTFDCTTMQTASVGYTVLKLFCGRDGKQCMQSSDSAAHIASGLYQLPLYPIKVPTDKRFDDKVFDQCSRIPCASLLVRVYPAPKSADGLSVLSREDFPEEDWVKMRVSVGLTSHHRPPW